MSKQTAIFVKVIFSFSLVLTLAACVALSPPAPSSIAIDQGNKIGVIVEASNYPKHTHFGNFLSPDFSKVYEYDWQIEESIIQALREQIEPNTEFQVVNLRSFDIADSAAADFVHSAKGEWTFHAGKAEQVKRLQQQGINIILNIAEMPTVAASYCSLKNYNHCHPLYSQGYGLVTQANLLGNTYYASASFETHIETLSPPSVLTKKGQFRGINIDERLNQTLQYLGPPNDFKNISVDELQPVKRKIIEHFSELGRKLTVYLNEKSI